MSSYTTTNSTTFTMTHAKRIASKVATDLMRFRRFYDEPTSTRIDNYEKELAVLLRYDVLDEVTYGFRKNKKWVTAVKYRAVDGELVADDNPGSLRAVSDCSGASFYSFLSYNGNWDKLSSVQKERIEDQLPFSRGTGTEPDIDGGYWVDDLGYSAGGRGLRRSKIQRYG